MERGFVEDGFPLPPFPVTCSVILLGAFGPVVGFVLVHQDAS
jgi:hypothetical protein